MASDAAAQYQKTVDELQARLGRFSSTKEDGYEDLMHSFQHQVTQVVYGTNRHGYYCRPWYKVSTEMFVAVDTVREVMDKRYEAKTFTWLRRAVPALPTLKQAQACLDNFVEFALAMDKAESSKEKG